MSVRKRRWTTAKGERKEAWVVDYVSQLGKRHVETFERKKEADDRWAAVKVDVRAGIHVAKSASPTVAEAADTWLREVKARNVERSTLRHYEQHVNLHIVPPIGRTKLAALTPDRITAFRDELLEKLSRPLARKVLVSFKSLLKVSRHSHVAVGVTIPKGRKEKRRIEAGGDFPTPAEVSRLLATAQGNPKQHALLLIFRVYRTSGQRVARVALVRRRLYGVRTACASACRRLQRYRRPQVYSSIRTIPIDPDVMVPALKKWKLKCPPSDFVFPTRTGKSTDYNSIVNGSFNPAMKAAKLVDKDGEPKYTPHALRHFFASWCINTKASGGRELPPKQVQYMLDIPPYR